MCASKQPTPCDNRELEDGELTARSHALVTSNGEHSDCTICWSAVFIFSNYCLLWSKFDTSPTERPGKNKYHHALKILSPWMKLWSCELEHRLQFQAAFLCILLITSVSWLTSGISAYSRSFFSHIFSISASLSISATSGSLLLFY